nr:hypothetical protein Iba_chr08bCG7090 [Ipomoea batatas]
MAALDFGGYEDVKDEERRQFCVIKVLAKHLVELVGLARLRLGLVSAIVGSAGKDEESVGIVDETLKDEVKISQISELEEPRDEELEEQPKMLWARHKAL